jgi:hypothetical protein
MKGGGERRGLGVFEDSRERVLHTRRSSAEEGDAGTDMRHHDGGKFRNPWVDDAEFGNERLGAVAKFMWASATRQARLPAKEELARLFPLGATDWQAIREPDPEKVTVTWIGHASFLVSVGNVTFLTDPVFSSRASPLPCVGPWRYAPLPFGVESLPKVDFVVISHSHYDHLDLPTVKQLGNGPKWFVGMHVCACVCMCVCVCVCVYKYIHTYV